MLLERIWIVCFLSFIPPVGRQAAWAGIEDFTYQRNSG